MKKYLSYIAIIVFLIGSSYSLAYAQLDGGGKAGSTNGGGTAGQMDGGGTAGSGTGNAQPISFRLDNPFGTKATTIPELSEAIFNGILMPIGGVVAVLAFIYSGFLYVTAQGDTGKIETANRALLYTAIGTAVLLGSWVIFQVIGNTIGSLQK